MLLILPVTAASAVIQGTGGSESPSSGEWTIPESSTLTFQKVSMYDPADFTITASGPDLSPEDLFESANDSLNNYTALFGKIVAPISLSNSCLSAKSLNIRKMLSKNALSSSPVSEGYLGISPVTVADDEKLAAYGFRVLPTGQTMMYTYIVSADANDTTYAAAREGLSEWMNTVNEKTNVASTSIVSNAAGISSITEPGWISHRATPRDYGAFGKFVIRSDWYWDPVEQNSYQDQFYTTTNIKMTPGIGYKNDRFTLTIDPGYSDLSGNAPHLPSASSAEETPTGTSSGQSVSCSLSSSSVGLSWTTDIPDTSLVFTWPSGQISKWDGTFNRGGNMAEQTFTFKSGVRIVCSQSESRNGNVYTLSKNTVDAYNAFADGVYSSIYGPTTNRYIPQELYIRWQNGEYKPLNPDL